MYILLLFLVLIGLIYYLTIWFRPQIFGYFPSSIKTKEKLISLSFDDGPNPPYTNQLLDILDKHNVKVTFFIPAKNMEKYPDLAREIIRRGHIIGNHSYSHKFINNIKSLHFEDEIVKSQNTITKIIHRIPALYRSPWLFKQPWLLKNLVKHGLTPVSGYFSSPWEIWHASGERIARDTMKNIAPGRIIIFHDGFNTKGAKREGTLEGVDIVISKVKEQGYKIINIDKLLDINPYQNL